VGLDKKPRELHVEQSLASIDFGDFEPPLAGGKFSKGEKGKESKSRSLVDDPLFKIDEIHLGSGAEAYFKLGKPLVIAVVKGEVEVNAVNKVSVLPGGFCLVPAFPDFPGVSSLRAKADAVCLVSRPG